MSGLWPVLGAALLIVGAVGIVVGGWTLISARRPPWLSPRVLSAGRERWWGASLLIIGIGCAAQGLTGMLDPRGEVGIFWVLRAAGLGLVLIGALLLLTVRPRSTG